MFRDYEISDAPNNRKCLQTIHKPILCSISNYKNSLYLGHFISSSRSFIKEYGDKTWGCLWFLQHWNQSSICMQSKGTTNHVCHTYTQFSENKRCNNIQNPRCPIFILSLRARSEDRIHVLPPTPTPLFFISTFFNRPLFCVCGRFLTTAEAFAWGRRCLNCLKQSTLGSMEWPRLYFIWMKLLY